MVGMAKAQAPTGLSPQVTRQIQANTGLRHIITCETEKTTHTIRGDQVHLIGFYIGIIFHGYIVPAGQGGCNHKNADGAQHDE